MLANPVPLSTVDDAEVEQLLDIAFGTDRKGRTAYMLRQYSDPIASLSWALLEQETLLGSIQCWPVRIGGSKLVLVGPVAVHPNRQGQGIGRRLMHTMLEHAEKLGNPAMVMIGDPEYYAPFGFDAAATKGWTLPGPWEQHRLLARNVAGTTLPATGLIEEDSDAL
jgi:predicted N-acetyltransferase YhbS